jgi:hypothetical protein
MHPNHYTDASQKCIDPRSAEFGRGIKRLLECPSSPTCPLCQQGGNQESYPWLYPPLQTELQYSILHTADRATVLIFYCRQCYSILYTADRGQSCITNPSLQTELQYKSFTADRATEYSTLQTELQ